MGTKAACIGGKLTADVHRLDNYDIHIDFVCSRCHSSFVFLALWRLGAFHAAAFLVLVWVAGRV